MTDIKIFECATNIMRIFDRLGKTVRKSQNLRGVLVHARKNNVNIVEIRALKNHTYGVVFWYDNGDHAVTVWQDWRVCLDWIKERRSWAVNRISMSASVYSIAFKEDKLASIRKSGTVVTSYID